jgi:crossover junction endodeoxyribonuclease RuvC
VRILGIDPGLRKTGIGIIDFDHGNLKYVHHGLLLTDSALETSARLNALHTGILDAIDKFTPVVAVVEEIFINVNPASTLKLGMARGVALFTPSMRDLPVFEYGANKIKKTVVGVGHADKAQVQSMVRMLLPTAPKDIPEDAADALAIAMCHAFHLKFHHMQSTAMVGHR